MSLFTKSSRNTYTFKIRNMYFHLDPDQGGYDQHENVGFMKAKILCKV